MSYPFEIPNGFEDKDLSNFVTKTKYLKWALNEVSAYVSQVIRLIKLQGHFQKNLFLVGNTGTGKTHLAYGILKSVLAQGISVDLVNYFSLVRLNNCDQMRHYLETSVLVIDNVAPLDDKLIDDFFYSFLKIRNDNNCATILISLEDDYDQLDKQMIDYLQNEGCRVVPVWGENFRPVLQRKIANNMAQPSK